MKKHIMMLLCAAALLLGMAAPPVLATEAYYPISVESYSEGNFDEPRIKKVYQLSLSDDPAGIPTEDFERDGRVYHLLDLIQKDEVGVDTQTHTETVTMDSKTGELSEILKQLDGQKEFTRKDGYSGILLLDHTSIKVEVKGYSSKTSNLSETRTYANLSDADLSLVPKTVSSGGRTLTLADVQWANTTQTEGEDTVQRYTATAYYSGTATSRYATGYTVTANYTGELSKTGCEVVTYTAIFAGEEITPEEQNAEQEIDSPARDISNIVLAGVMVSVAVLTGTLIWHEQRKKGRGNNP